MPGTEQITGDAEINRGKYTVGRSGRYVSPL